MPDLRHVFICLLILSHGLVLAQVTPPCGNFYGSLSDKSNIEFQMRYGDVDDAIAAINQGKNTRGTSLGCPQFIFPRVAADTAKPFLSQIEDIWNTVHAPIISSLEVTCPRIGRYENNSALGAYYAMQAGYFQDTSKLAEIADMMYDQQYADWNISSPNPRNEGVYAYISVDSTEACYPGGVVGSSVTDVCAALPDYCVDYENGLFAGTSFLTTGQVDTSNWFDGGLAYDHGWVGVQMIQSAITQEDTALKHKYRQSIQLAGQFCLSEYPVKNHNYTSKLTWLLAQLYAWTGDTIYKNELNHKLDKNLLPGILWDADNDGFVDGTSPAIAFSSLSTNAQQPGRMWDGHNAVSWYHAMNTWAMIEAYVAFRDRGDNDRADELKPYAVAMLDNLSREIIDQGIPASNQLGVRDMAYALLVGIWKVSQYENEVHPIWEQSAWALWNAGYFDDYNTNSVCVGLYLLIGSNTPYIPLASRQDFILSSKNPEAVSELFDVYPNPIGEMLYVSDNKLGSTQVEYSITNNFGQKVQSGQINHPSTTIQLLNLPTGTYSIHFRMDHNMIIRSFVKN